MRQPDLKVDEGAAAIETTEELLSRLQQIEPVHGVNVCGYLRTESGVGEAARRYIRALEAASIPVALRDLSAISGNRAQDRTLAVDEAKRQEWFDVNLICVDIDLHYAALFQLGEAFLEERYNIALWWWEQPAFPLKWADRFAYYDEVWAGSTFIANALAPISPIPIVHMPPALAATGAGSRQRGRVRLGLAEDTYMFLFIFDFHSHVERKNPLGVIEAFRCAFGQGPGEDVQLVIKCVNGASNPEALAQMQARAGGYPITIYEGYWPAVEIDDLLAACDAYVSLHRSEGEGLPIADAMAVGKPVIATGWSGNMDYMNVSNSYPIAYEMVELRKNVGPYRAGELWAEPSVEHAAQLMREVNEDRQQAQRRGEAAQRTVERDFSLGRSGQRMAKRLRAIALRRQLPQFREVVQERYHHYQRLPARIREIAGHVLPRGATVAVVSKGDDALLQLDRCNAWHYPQDETGRYRGYYPADGQEALAHLQELQARGADYLLLPSSAYWWLEHYDNFAHYLETAGTEVWCDESCIIYRLQRQDRGVVRLTPAQQQPAIHLDALSAMEQTVRQKVHALEAHLAQGELSGAHAAEEQPDRVENLSQSAKSRMSLRRPLRYGSAQGQPDGPEADGAAEPVSKSARPSGDSGRAFRKQLAYPQTIANIRETVRAMVPPEMTVAVVSKGDDELLQLDRPAWHFPRQEDGTYAGYYPATGSDAVEHLEALRAAGAEVLIFPNTAFWWLDHYEALQNYLASTALWVHKDEWCIIYRLPPARLPATKHSTSLWRTLTRPFRTRM